jgi:hypothetical protein
VQKRFQSQMLVAADSNLKSKRGIVDSSTVAALARSAAHKAKLAANKADLELVARVLSMYRKQPTAGDRWTSPLAKELKV